MNSLLRFGYQEIDCNAIAQPLKDEDDSSSGYNFPMMLRVYSVLMESSSYEDLTSPPLASVPFQWEEIPGKPKPFSCRTKDQCAAATFSQSYSLRLPPRMFWEDQYRENSNISVSPFCQGVRKKQLGSSSSLEAKKHNEIDCASEIDQNKKALTRIKRKWRFSSLIQKKTRPWATNAYQCFLKKMRFGHSSSRKF